MFSSLPAKAYIFDNDGTLVDTESIWLEVYRRLLRSHDLEYTPALHRQMIGQSASVCVEMLQHNHPSLPQGVVGTKEIFSERRHLFWLVRSETGVHPRPGACEFLKRAHEKGILLAMATSATREEIELELDLLEWRAFFLATVTADDVKRCKPAPDVYLEAAARLGVEANDCLVFEDAVSGLLSARAAGMQTVFVRDDRFKIAPPFEPACTVASFKELLGDWQR